MKETHKYNSFVQLSLYDELKPGIVLPQESDHDQWTAEAYDFLLEYIKDHDEFRIEDVRIASKGIVPVPNELRSWGSVAVVAKNSGLIELIRYGKSNNIKAHNTLVSYWKVVKAE